MSKRLLYGLTILLLASGLASAQIVFESSTQAYGIDSNGVIHVGAGAVDSRDNCGSVTPAIPAGNAGDVLVALVGSRENGATLTQGGAAWNTLFYDNAGDNFQVAIYWRIATGADSLTLSQSGSCDSLGAQVARFSGVDTTGETPFDSISPYYGAVRQDSGNLDTGTITTNSATAMLLVAGLIRDNRTVAEGAGWNQSFDTALNVASDLGLSLHYQAQTTAGSKSVANWDLSGGGTDINYGIILGLKPAPVGKHITIPMPAGVSSGDVLVASVAVRHYQATVTPPSGWTPIQDGSQSSGATSCSSGSTAGIRVLSYYKVAGAGEPAAVFDYSSTCNDDGFGSGGIMRFSGVDTTSPVVTSAKATTGSGTLHAAPAVTPGIANTMLVTVHSFGSSRSWNEGYSGVSGMTEAVDQRSYNADSGLGTTLGVYVQALSGTGSTGTRTAQAAGDADYGATQSLLLRPVTLNCFTDSFSGANGSSPSSDWTTSSSSGSFGQPKIYNNRLRLTDATNNVATAAHLQRLFPGAGNKIIVEFDYFAYNGSGADGIALTLSDASATPQAGAYGGSLGYAQRCSTNGFAGGWLGVGIDEYGNFRNDEECRGDGGSPTGTVPDSVSVRGSGSGTTGYLIHAESGWLSPGVDQPGATAGPNHRYRVTVDHSDGTHAYVKVQRDSGGGFATIIPQYDAKTQSGQASVPTNWLLSYTGSTGGANNIHEIDNLSVCTTQPILSLGPASILVSAPASASTCGTAGGTPAAPVVTVTAKDGAGGTGSMVTSYTGTVTLVTSTGRGTWAKVTGQADGTLVGNQYTFAASDNGDAQFYLVSGVGENLTVTATDTTTAASGTSDTVQFRDNAFVVTPTDALGTTIVAGRDHAMQVVFWKKDPTTGLCGVETSYTGSHNLDAWYTPDVSHPAGASAPSIGGLTLPTADPGGQAVYNLGLSFTNGVATFNLTTGDVGKYTLNFEDDTRTFSNAVDIAGSSGTLTARPFALQAAVAGNPGASAAGGTVFTSAGSNFSATVSGVLWQAADDGNNDGIPDLTGAALNAALADNTAAPRFAWATTLAPDSAGYTPAGGTLGGLANGSIAQGSYSGGSATVTTLQYSEVGSFTLLATASNYLNSGLTLSANAGVVGRFKPHHFVMTPSLTNRQGASCAPASTFTYMGEPLRISLGLVAEKEGGGTTVNYDSTLGFARLDPATANWLALGASSSLGMGAIQGTTPLSSRLSVSGTPSGSWTSGTATLLADLLFSRPATTTPDTTWGPYETLQLGALPQDADGVTLQPAALDLDGDASGGNERQLAGTTKQRYGRLFLENAYGSEKLTLVMPVRAEYWNGSYWVVNNDDSCSVLGSPSLTSNPAGLATAPSLGGSWAYGRGSIVLSAPNAPGSVAVSLDVPDYLRYFDYDGGSLDNPRGTAQFGLFKPNRAFIYQREAY